MKTGTPDNKPNKGLVRKIKLSIGKVAWNAVWASANTMQRYNINLVPINYYSNTPSRQEIEDSFEFTESDPPYLNRDLFHDDRLANTLDELAAFSSDFNPAMDGDEKHSSNYYWNNSQFSYTDAMAYYCFIRQYRPQHIVEIGSGFSSLIALDALQKNGRGSLTTIEPFPRPFLENNDSINLVRKKAQEIDAEFLNATLEDGDILFIDSTHTVKTGSDCLHIFLRLLPHIKKNILVHVHDIFLPYGIPKDWQLEKQIFWTEQYLLMALLTDNPKTRLLYSGIYNVNYQRERMDRLMDGKFPPGGSSVWFSYDGASGGTKTKP
jgi:predicted O-methyltransferase YrrM